MCESQTQVMVSFQRMENHSQVKFSLLRSPGVSDCLAPLLLIWGCLYCALWVWEANREVSCGQKCHADVTSLTKDPLVFCCSHSYSGQFPGPALLLSRRRRCSQAAWWISAKVCNQQWGSRVGAVSRAPGRCIQRGSRVGAVSGAPGWH